MAASRASGDRELRNLGRRVAELRIERGFTQERLAERLDRDIRYVQDIEAGQQNVTVRTATLVARVLRVPIGQLFVVPTARGTSRLRRVPTRTVRKK